MLDLLPDDEQRAVRPSGTVSEELDQFRYEDLIHAAEEAMTRDCADELEKEDLMRDIHDLSQRAVEAFLWSATQSFPPHLKQELTKILPLNLRSRMNLYSGGNEEEKVA